MSSGINANPAAWLPLALRIAGFSILLSAAYALLAHGVSVRDLIDDVALGAFGVAVMVAAPRAVQSWPLFLFGVAMSAVILVAGALDWGYRAGLVFCLMAFTWALLEAYSAFVGCKRVVAPAVQKLALRTKTQYGVTLDELTKLTPVLLVFLRHVGCTFCREALKDLAEQRQAIEAEGVRIAVVFMARDERAGEAMASYGLEDINRVSDPQQHVYRAFGLCKGRLLELFGPHVLWRGFWGLVRGHGWTPPRDEGFFQMPGVFLLFHGEILRAYRHQSVADRPNYLSIVQGDSLSELSSRG